MRPLPPQVLHLPFGDGPYRMAMDLVTVPEPAWFEIDECYPAEMATRRALLADRHADVFDAGWDTEAATAETLDLIASALCRHHPDWFARDRDCLRNSLTGEVWPLTALRVHPLEAAGRLVQEDLCLIRNTDAGPVLAAAVLCFPSRWRLSEKIGRPLAEVHAPVPLYPDRLSRPVDRFMRHLRDGHIASRLNWSLLDDAALFQPAGKWRTEQRSDITAANAGETVFLRVERQTLRRLPVSGFVLFGIRVHVYPLRCVAGRAAALAAAVRVLPPAIQHYKSLPAIREAVLGWLDAQAAINLHLTNDR